MNLSNPATPDDEAAHLRERLQRLAEEKSYLQLVMRLIERINPLAGLDDMVRSLLQDIVETLGGTNIRIWYWLGDTVYYADVLGGTAVLTELNDPLAQQVARERTLIEVRGEADAALLKGGALPDSWTWCFPLLVGPELIGVIKLENVHISGASLRAYLPTFFSHTALIMSNEIRVLQRHEALVALQRTTEELDNYFNNALDLFCIADTDGHFRKMNPAWERTLGYAAADLEGRAFLDLVHPDDLPATLHAVEQLKAQNIVANFINRYRAADGSWHWIEWHSRPRGKLIYAAARDITEAKLAEDNLRLAASVFANSQEGIIITDASNCVVEVNEAFTRITGYSRDDVISHNPRLLKSGRHDRSFYTGMWETIQRTGNWRGEIWNRRKDGAVYAEMLCIDVVRGEDGALKNYVGAFSDISHIKEHQAALEHIAHFDTLTGLPNRRLLADRLHQELARARRGSRTLAICYLDLDGFKPVNDQFGHEAGDLLLIEISKRLQSMCRIGDTVARLGGDEFVLLFGDLAHEQECFRAIERVLAIVAKPIALEDGAVNVGASIGVTLFPRDDVDADTLLRHADQAMYQAKESGKNRFHVFDAEHDRLVKANRDTLARLEEALRDNEFELYYQPKVDMAKGEVIGAEALIRWRHPQRGLLAPAEFLPLLEGTELELSLGEWVIESALRQLSAWTTLMPSLIVSVNVSARQLLRSEFVPRLQAALARHPEVKPQRIELEILESAAIDDITNASRTLSACIALGLHFALDDFGTGYSSLTYFRKLPVGTLKIDQGFVRNMVEDPEDLSIIESVIAMARAFNRPVIAEGVETIDHGAMLVMLGCTLGQGYGIARPMPASKLPEWVAQWRGEDIWRTLGNYALPAEDLVLIVANRAHNKWFETLLDYLHAPGCNVTPVMQHTLCPMGRWLYGSAVSRYGSYPEFRDIDALHMEIHSVAVTSETLALNAQVAALQPQLGELARLHERLDATFGRLVMRMRAAGDSDAQNDTGGALQANLFGSETGSIT